MRRIIGWTLFSIPDLLSARFSRLAARTAAATGSWKFLAACIACIAIWILLGPFVGFFNTMYQLIPSNIISIVTLLLVGLVQNSQNRESAAVLLKLDELLRANHEARNQLVGLEDKTEEEIARVKAEFAALASGPVRDARGRFARADTQNKQKPP